MRYFVLILIGIFQISLVNAQPKEKASLITLDTAKILKNAENYLIGNTQKPRPDSAVVLLTPLTKAGNAEALFLMGNLLLRGSKPHVSKNIPLAIKYLEQSAKSGNIQAIQVLITLYSGMEGNAMFSDPEIKAKKNNTHLFTITQLGASLNDPMSACWLAICFMDGKGTIPKVLEAKRYLQFSAEHNFPLAQVLIGDGYYFGKNGIHKHLDSAVYWYHKLHYNPKASLQEQGLGLEGKLWCENVFTLLWNNTLKITFFWERFNYRLHVWEVKKEDRNPKRF
jgi:TPR repeat protein